jgi:hypothetical protein
LFNPAAKAPEGRTMRAKSQWTSGGIVLWLIAGILATLIVCGRTEPDPESAGTAREVELDVEIVE